MAKRNWLIGVVLVSVFVMLPLGMAQAQDSLSMWQGKWFKVTYSKTAFHYPGPGVKPTPNALGTSSGPGYLYVTGVDLTQGAEKLTLIAYTKDPDTGNWSGIPFATIVLNYFAGDYLNFSSWGGFDNGALFSQLGIQITGVKNKKTGLLQSGTFKTLGGFVMENDDVPGSTELWAGGLKINGTWVDQSKVPVDLTGSIPH
jgi:hypothetical protein